MTMDAPARPLPAEPRRSRSRLGIAMLVVAGLLIVGAAVFAVVGFQAQTKASDERDPDHCGRRPAPHAREPGAGLRHRPSRPRAEARRAARHVRRGRLRVLRPRRLARRLRRPPAPVRRDLQQRRHPGIGRAAPRRRCRGAVRTDGEEDRNPADRADRRGRVAPDPGGAVTDITGQTDEDRGDEKTASRPAPPGSAASCVGTTSRSWALRSSCARSRSASRCRSRRHATRPPNSERRRRRGSAPSATAPTTRVSSC